MKPPANKTPDELVERIWKDWRGAGGRLSWSQLAAKYGKTRNSISGLMSREKRKRAGLPPPPRRRDVADEPRSRKTVSLPIVRWGQD